MPVHIGPKYVNFDEWYMHYWTKVRDISFNSRKNRVQLLDVNGNPIMTVDGIDTIGPSFKAGGDTLEISDFIFDTEYGFMEIKFTSDVEVTYTPTNPYAETRLLVHKQGYLSTAFKNINIEE